METVRATYRLQFTPSFTFRDATRIIGYLKDLGISHVYASPIFAARPGSTHGYDVIAPDRLNPELGTMREFEELLDTCRANGLGWIQDIVPNHMAFASENRMLMDVLEYGMASPYVSFFDIDWDHPYENLRGKVLAPFLGKFYGECLEQGEITLGMDDHGIYVRYYDLRLPLRIDSYAALLDNALGDVASAGAAQSGAAERLRTIAAQFRSLPDGPGSNRRDLAQRLKAQLLRLVEESGEVRSALETSVGRMNGTPGVPGSFRALEELLGQQYFRLSFWKVATEEINYRRFFNINQLISVRVEDEPVFRSTHAFLLSFLVTGRFSGVRVDHVDGLYDPLAYLRRLRAAAPDSLIYVEKILQPDEELPASWPVQGTTGYDFLNWVNGLLCEREHDRRFQRIYERFIGSPFPFDQLAADKKRLIIGRHMAGDVDRVAQLLKRITGADRHARDMTLYGIRRALVEILAWFPVYRTYVSPAGYEPQDRRTVEEALRKAIDASPALELEVRFIGRFLLMEQADTLSEEERRLRLQVVMSFQQMTGPLMAKGFEDTLLYIYNRLVALNEVGGHPIRFGVSPVEFHQANKKRAAHWPASMNTTATHDTKRGEDTRAFITVLSEIPDIWAAKVSSWRKMNARNRVTLRGKPVPDPNEEYLLYQTIVGTLPLEGGATDTYRERIRSYAIKAVREAKVHTAWLKPDEEYERGYLEFVDALLTGDDNPFLRDLAAFRQAFVLHGMLNALSQLVLKLTAPGVPDIYQGTELWDFTLVDPDNRRPVDFHARERMLEDVRAYRESGGAPEGLLSSWPDARVKMMTMLALLDFRRRSPEVFARGQYLPLGVRGSQRRHCFAFARRAETRSVMVVVPRLTAGMVSGGALPLGTDVWEDTIIETGGDLPGRWREVFTGTKIEGHDALPVSAILQRFPVAVLEGTGDE